MILANQSDSLIINQLVNLPDQDAFNFFIANSRFIKDDAEKYTAISWTLSEDVAKNVFSLEGEREVVSRWFYKEDIFAYFDRRSEQEIIVIGAK